MCCSVQLQFYTGSLLQMVNNVEIEVPPLHLLEMPLKPDEDSSGQVAGPSTVPIVAPHEVLAWLLDNNLINLNDAEATKFWEHHRAVQTPYLDKAATCKDGFVVHPLTIYGDEAEYTQTKQKILTIFLSHSTVHLQALELSFDK